MPAKSSVTVVWTAGSTFSGTSSTIVTSAYGRTGDVVGEEGDYNLDQMSDVDTTTEPPTDKSLLSWDGTTWAPENQIDSGTFA